LTVVLYGYETCDFTLGGGQRIIISEIGKLKEKFGLKWQELPGGLRELHNEKLYDLLDILVIR
jgi:hypothetical protein